MSTPVVLVLRALGLGDLLTAVPALRGPRSHALLDAVRPAHRIGHAAPGWAGPRWNDDIAQRRRWCDLLA